jgi:hypothetical protein
MRRMRNRNELPRPRPGVVAWGVAWTVLAAWGSSARADLIRTDAPRAYPDIAADINGVVNYTYNPATRTGVFNITNTPYLLAGGPQTSEEFAVSPTADGVRRQVLNVTLNQNGRLVANPGNRYELYGTVTTGNQTYSGLLLKGTPIAFGSQFTPAGPGQPAVSLFDLNINITGGELASAFGPDVYIQYMPELNNTFQGRFDTGFTAAKATSNTRAYHAPLPFPAPEPTTLALLLAGGAGLAYRHWRKRRGGFTPEDAKNTEK